jgi:hypothetical protein
MYDSKTGYSTVTIEHMGKRFFGIASLHPDDKDKASKYAGCSYAETRAEIKALKYERKIAKEKAEEFRKIVKACEQYKNWDKNSPSAKIIYRQLNLKIRKVNELTDIINQKMKNLEKAIWKRDITIKAFERNRSKKINMSK